MTTCFRTSVTIKEGFKIYWQHLYNCKVVRGTNIPVATIYEENTTVCVQPSLKMNYDYNSQIISADDKMQTSTVRVHMVKVLSLKEYIENGV